MILSACVQPGSPQIGATEAQIGPQVLVMLPLSLPHFRPDTSYGSDYASRGARSGSQHIAERIATDHGLRLVDGWPMAALGIDCYVMELPDTAAVEEFLERLSKDSRILWTQPVNQFHVLGQSDPLFPLQPAATRWHLDELHRIATGLGVQVAEVDTGVDILQPDLRGQIALTANFVDANPYVAEVHGTEIAGIIVARPDNGVGIKGVAPRAKVLAFRACWQQNDGGDTAVCTSFSLAKALQAAIDHDAQVINLSLSGPNDLLLERLIDAALDHGITVVAAADPQKNDGGFPASHPGVLSVSFDDSETAINAKLTAPGRDIPTCLPGGRWGFVSGSSFAAAHMTGLVALLKQLQPQMNAKQVLTALKPTDTHNSTDGRIDACAVIASAARICTCGCDAVQKEIHTPSMP